MNKDIDFQRVGFRAVFESAPELFLLLLPDPEFTIVTASKAYCQATMRESVELTGRPIFEAFPDNPDDPAATGVANLRRSLGEAIRSRRPHRMEIQKYDVARPISEGGGFEERWWSPLNTPVVNDKNEVEYIIHQVVDVTENIRLKKKAVEQSRIFFELQRSESELRQSKANLTKALKARDELLSICSHELRTPVASMKLQTQMTKRNILKGDPRALAPDRMQKLIEQSDRQLDRMTRLIEEMLDFSRIQSGRLKLRLEEFDLVGLLSEVTERFEPQATAAGCTLKSVTKAGVVGTWDRIRLDQVFTNLLGNAIKYAPGAPIEMILEASGTSVIFKITDHGAGIDQAHIRRIFEPYERAVSVTSISGLGLGLYITRQIVEDHGGSIHAVSELSGGATFIVELPLRTDAVVPGGNHD